MNPVMLDLGVIQIKWYSFFIFIAMITGSILFFLEAKKKGLKSEDIENILFYGLLFGIIGTRLYYVLFNLDYYLSNPLEIIMVWKGGLAIHGGIIGGFLTILIYSKKKNINLLMLLDIIAVGLIIAQALGRWGNFFNSEAYGRITTLQSLKNLHIPMFIVKGMLIDGSYREPTFLYESIFSFLGFILLLGLRGKYKNLKVGQLAGTYLFWYGLVRIFIEALRTDSLMLGPIKVAQLVSIIFMILGAYLLQYNHKSKKTYHDLIIYN